MWISNGLKDGKKLLIILSKATCLFTRQTCFTFNLYLLNQKQRIKETLSISGMI